MPQITYTEALALINKWTIDSGIRKFCSEVCKGGCCTPCHWPHYCEVGSDCKNIACCAFTCYDINSLLPKTQQLKLSKVREYIYSHIGDCYSKAYFEAHRSGVLKKIIFDYKRLVIFETPIQIDFSELEKRKSTWIKSRQEHEGKKRNEKVSQNK
jgi:hypothetical protein